MTAWTTAAPCWHLVDTKTREAYFEDYDSCSKTAAEARADRYRAIREGDIEDPALVAIQVRTYACSTISCDGCGRELVDQDTSFTAHLESGVDLPPILQHNGWITTFEGAHLCDDCVDAGNRRSGGAA